LTDGWSFQWDRIPDELKEYRQWHLWRIEERNGTPTKVPYRPVLMPPKRPIARTPLDITKTKRLVNFDEAVKEYESYPSSYSGIGFVFTEEDPFVGLDWDKVRDPQTGIWQEEILHEILSLESYAELSPSKSGAHVIAKAKIPGEKRRSGIREIYASRRYFTMTGWHIDGTPSTVNAPNPDAFEQFYASIAGTDQPRKEPDRLCISQGDIVTEDDDEIIARCASAANSAKFLALYRGDTSGYPSASEADLAFCAILAFYTQDSSQIDRIVRSSRLYRKKWDQRRGPTTYGELTISTAIQGLHDVCSRPQRLKRRNQEFESKNRSVFDASSEEDLWKM